MPRTHVVRPNPSRSMKNYSTILTPSSSSLRSCSSPEHRAASASAASATNHLLDGLLALADVHTARFERRCSTLGVTTPRTRPYSGATTVWGCPPCVRGPRLAPRRQGRCPPRVLPAWRYQASADDEVSETPTPRCSPRPWPSWRPRPRPCFVCRGVCFLQETGSDDDAHVLDDPKQQKATATNMLH